MNAVITLALKDMKALTRDRFALFWVFAFPLLYALFFGAIFGGEGDGARSRISLAIVDEDHSEGSARFAEELAGHESLRVQREGEGEGAERPVRFSSLADARDAVRVGDRVAYIRILPGYGDSPFAVFAADEGSKLLEVGIDPSRKAEAGMLQGILMQAMFAGMTDTFTDKPALRAEIERGRDDVRQAEGLNGAQKLVLDTFLAAVGSFLEDVDLDVLEEGTGGVGAGSLVEIVEVTRDRGDRPQSPFEITFPSAMVWGLMSVALTFAITLVRERTQGTLLRLRIAPVSRAQILGGKALACFTMCQVVLIVLIGFAALALDIRLGNPLLLAMAMVSTAACFTGLMMISSVLGKTEQAVAGAAWGAMMPFAMIGGGMIPLIAMPPWLLSLSDFSPFKWGIYSMEGAIWRGFDLTEMLRPCGILVGLGAAFFGVGVWLFQRLDR